MDEFGALIVDLSVGIESERDESVRVVEGCVFDFLPAGRPFRRAARTRRREVQIGVGDGIGDVTFFPSCRGMSVMPSGRLPSPLERPVGSSTEEMFALTKARQMMSLSW